jgi:hypothetical protein
MVYLIIIILLLLLLLLLYNHIPISPISDYTHDRQKKLLSMAELGTSKQTKFLEQLSH